MLFLAALTARLGACTYCAMTKRYSACEESIHHGLWTMDPSAPRSRRHHAQRFLPPPGYFAGLLVAALILVNTATVTDPFGNLIGIIENPHFKVVAS